MDSTVPAGSFLAHFAERVRLDADRVAVRAGAHGLTFAELARRASSVAQAIHAAVGTGTEPVTVLAGHDEQAVVGFVAAAIVHRPAVLLDTTTPVERMHQVVTIAGPAVTLVGEGYGPTADTFGNAAGLLVDLGPRGVQPADDSLPDLLSYPWPTGTGGPVILDIVFTSGSTGVPKGVALPDLAFTEELLATDLGQAVEEVAVPAPLGFVMGAGTVVRNLLVGSTVHLWDPRRSGIAAMVPWLVESGITSITATPNFFRNLAKSAIDQGVVLESLRVAISGGEQLYASDVELLRRCTTDDLVVVNAAGSSEGWGVASLTIDRKYPLPPGSARMPIGRPADGRELLLVDDDLVPLADPHAAGLILLVADNVAAGYWNQPELTRQRFITLPDGRHAYVTGDRGFWNADGQLELVGRSDHMLKIRGNLVEPAEVEAQIRATAEVVECVVVGRPDREGTSLQLVAYVVPQASTWISGAALRRRLAKVLPLYMVPARVVELTALPRNANGKIDRLALPAGTPPAPAAPEPAADGHMTALHDAIAAICARALGVEAVGKHDDLFELGADSLAVEEITAALDTDLHLHVTSTALMENPTVALIADLPRKPPELVGGVLVRLAEGSADKQPVFFVAGAGGLAIGFRDLALHLTGGRPLFGLQAHGIEGGGRPDLSFAATVRRYVRAVRSVQPRGPYALVGHSLGALLAYEMARTLTAQGATVTFLGLLDPLGDAGSDKAGAPAFLRNQGQLDPAAPPQPAGRRGLAHGTRERLRAERPYLTRSFWRVYRDQPFVAHWELGSSLAHGYAPPRTALTGVRCVVYGAAEQLGGLSTAPVWSPFVNPEPEQITVGGDHLTMLRPPFVSQLAQRLDADLEKAEVPPA